MKILVLITLAAAQATTSPQEGSPRATPPQSPPVELTLQAALEAAKSRNLDLKVAQAQLAQSQEISRKAWAGYLPHLSAGASYTRNNTEAKIRLPADYWIREVPGLAQSGDSGPPAGMGVPGSPTDYALLPAAFVEAVIQKQDQLGAQAQLSQALLVPSLWSAISNAYLVEEVAELNVENARREILFAVAQLYYGAVSLKETLAVQERLLETNRAHERDAKTRVAAGAMPRIALVRAQIDRTRAEQDLRRAQNAYASAKIALATMLDMQADAFEVTRPPELQLDIREASLEEDALRDRPDVKAARKNVELADGTHDGVWLKYLPSVAATGTYLWANVSGFTGRNDSWSVMIGVSWDLWDGGLRESELRETEAQLVEAEAAARATELKARDEVKRALLDLESARANRIKAEEQANLARENMQLVNVNFQNGVATQLDVTDATTALASAELGAVAETLNAQLAVLRLLKAAGSFNP